MFARPLWWRVSADDEFLFLNALELDPRAASATRLVNRVALFADQTFETTTLHLIEKRFSITTNCSGVADRIIGIGRKLFEHVLSRFQWYAKQVFAVEL